MDNQPPSDEPKTRQTAVRSSIRKLRERLVPGVKYTLLISAAVNFAMLVVGCLNVHKCPVNKNIPLFLIATGAIGLVSKFVSYVRNRLSSHVQVVYIESALYSVETIFFFLGTYWVYKEFQPSYDPINAKLYCNKTAYLFAFTYLTIFYGFIVALLLGFCCFICCLCLLFKINTMDVESQHSQPTANNEATEKLTKNETESKA
ncbi:hypothetical protein MTP99_009207 [Tenebrio molitor]|jgi:hypothetical protein|nr:hypothetical protein MTP99_009207 [Tenebrio molitor]